MLLAIEIGNTNIHVGFFEEKELRTHFSMGSDPHRSEDEYAWSLSSLASFHSASLAQIDGVIIGSVVPSMTRTLKNAVQKITNAPIMTVGPGIKTGFPIRIDDPGELGADIAATTAATLGEVGCPAVVADFGTATVISLIDSDGAYVGGSILPGIGMSLSALQNAELLPEVPPKHSVLPLGKNSADCMRTGVLRGEALTLCGFYDLYRKAYNLPEETPLVVSGGFAEYLLPYLPKNAKHIPLLALLGLERIYRLNRRQKS